MNPLESVFSLFTAAFSAVFGWFFQILTASGAVGVYLAVFAIFCVVRFLIVPLIGSNDSQKAGED